MTEQIKELEVKDRSEVKEEMFKLLAGLDCKFSERLQLMNLIFDLDLSAYKAGLDEGARIAEDIFVK